MVYREDVMASKVIHTEPLNGECLLEVEALKAQDEKRTRAHNTGKNVWNVLWRHCDMVYWYFIDLE